MKGFSRLNDLLKHEKETFPWHFSKSKLKMSITRENEKQRNVFRLDISHRGPHVFATQALAADLSMPIYTCLFSARLYIARVI